MKSANRFSLLVGLSLFILMLAGGALLFNLQPLTQPGAAPEQRATLVAAGSPTPNYDATMRPPRSIPTAVPPGQATPVAATATVNSLPSSSRTARPLITPASPPLLALPTVIGIRGASPARLTAPRQIQRQNPFWPKAIHNQTLVGWTEKDGARLTVALDLETGEEQVIFAKILGDLKVSSQWIVGIDATDNKENFHIYDRNQHSKVSIINIASSLKRNLDLLESLVVWNDYRSDHRDKPQVDIYGYDLAQQKEFALVQRSGLHMYPKLSDSWLVYTDYELPIGSQGNRPITVDLRALNLSTKEDFKVGETPYPNPVWGDSYALSGSRLIWTTCSDPLKGSTCGIYLYDLATRNNHLVIPNEQSHHLQFSGDYLAYLKGGDRVVVDLKSSTPIDFVGASTGLAVLDLVLSNEHVIWSTSTTNLSSTLHTRKFAR